jgi:drug/metabolite transporter (DMT)-like permease
MISISSVIFVKQQIMTEKRKIWHWFVLALLSLIWGTSYILMKKGLQSFSSSQVGSLRILITFLCLSPVAIKNINKLNRNNILSVFLIGLMGSALPAFLFPLAETRISSSLAGMLNALSPVFTLLLGIFVYKRQAIKTQVAGIILGLIGAVGLLYNGSFTVNYYGFFVVLATLMYGFSSNEVSKVKGLNGIQIAALSFLLTSPIAIVSLLFSDMSAAMNTQNWVLNLGYISILAIFGSAVALALFYILIRDTSPVFAATVTYFIPIIATIWGIEDHEKLTGSMIVSMIIIFAGVFIINRPDFFRKSKVNSNE